jgi:site-specific recombinase XerD
VKPTTLAECVAAYFDWMRKNGYAESTIRDHRSVLRRFTAFAARRKWSMETALQPKNRAAFRKKCGMTKASGAMLGFSRYLEDKGFIRKASVIGNLPEPYEAYLTRLRKLRNARDERLNRIGKILGEFHRWLTKMEISLEALTIGQVDDFLSAKNRGLAPRTRSDNRGIIRKFLAFLHAERGVPKRDLAAFILSPPHFGYDNPPKYLRKPEIRRLFAVMDLSTPEGLRTFAMIRLACTTGLRPGEIARIRMEDLSFTARELTVPERKGDNPVRFPLPEETVKALAAYIIGARPRIDAPQLFVSLSPPHRPITGGLVSDAIGKAMKAAGIPGTPYHLRHTYAQNLLESGASLFEIKEMLGHDCIKATKRYLHIHIRLMRKVLFDD